MKVTFLFLEIEDMLALGFMSAISMIVGQWVFPDRYVFGIPMNWFLVLVVLGVGVPGLVLFKYGKPRGYLWDLVKWCGTPHAYCAHARDTKLTTDYLKEED